MEDWLAYSMSSIRDAKCRSSNEGHALTLLKDFLILMHDSNLVGVFKFDNLNMGFLA